MTEQWENSDGLRELTERLHRLDSGIPVPEAVTAPQLLARMEREAQRPVLRALRPRWQKVAGMAAAFVLVLGGVWLARGYGGLSLSSGEAAQSSAAAAQEPEAAAEAFGLMVADEAAQVAPVAELAEEDEAAVSGYAVVRERLTALQGKEEYYVTREQATRGNETETGGAGAGGGAGGMVAGNADGNAKAEMGAMGRGNIAGMAAGSLASTDIVRTDGSSLYYLTVPVGTRVPVVKIVNMNGLTVEATISFPRAGTVSDLHVEDGMLAVLYSDENFYTLPVYERQVEKAPMRSGVAAVSATVLEVYDVSNGAQPVSTRKFEQQGDYILAEVNEGVVSLVTDCTLLTNAHNTAAKDEELVPALRDPVVSNEVTPIPAGGICLPEGATEDRYAVVSFVSLKDAAEPAKTKAVLGGTTAAYHSGTALYVAGSFAGEGKTGLVKFTMQGGELVLAAQGYVSGYVESADALNERNGKLYVLSITAGKPDLYVLDGALKWTETITLWGRPGPMCFAGNTLYLVDEHNVLRAIAVPGGERGQTEVGGAVTNLYALPDGNALALGYDAQKNLEAVLYGTSGQRLGAVKLGGRGSAVVAPEGGELPELEDGMLALPVLLYGTQGETFNGFVVLKIAGGSITELGRAATAQGMAENELYAKGLDARGCVIAQGKVILLSRAQAVSYALPGLAQQKIVLL